MRIYNFYWIKDEFIHHFYGRESMFFQLFKEYEESCGDRKGLIGQQILYITRPLPVGRILSHLASELAEQVNFRDENEQLFIRTGKGKGDLTVSERAITLQVIGGLDVEAVIFSAMAKLSWNFFVVDLKNVRYGWLKPERMKQAARS
jgi:Protein of unknown function (DUF2522).